MDTPSHSVGQAGQARCRAVPDTQAWADLDTEYMAVRWMAGPDMAASYTAGPERSGLDKSVRVLDKSVRKLAVLDMADPDTLARRSGRRFPALRVLCPAS